MESAQGDTESTEGHGEARRTAFLGAQRRTPCWTAHTSSRARLSDHKVSAALRASPCPPLPPCLLGRLLFRRRLVERQQDRAGEDPADHAEGDAGPEVHPPAGDHL